MNSIHHKPLYSYKVFGHTNATIGTTARRPPIWFWGKNYWGRIYSLRICMGIKVCFKENEFFEISWGKKFWGKNLHGSQFPVQKFRRRLCRGRIYSEPMKPCWQGGSTILYKNIKLYTSSHRSKNYLHICWDFIYCFFCYIIPGNGQFGQWTKLFPQFEFSLAFSLLFFKPRTTAFAVCRRIKQILC